MEKRSDGELSSSWPCTHDDHDKYVHGSEILEELVKVDDGTENERVMISEIEELMEEEEEKEKAKAVSRSHIEFDGGLQGVGDIVCVVIYGDVGGDDDDHGSGSSKSVSMDALLWTLTNGNGNGNGSSLFLVHVYPPLRFIPTALGKLPINQANEEQRNIHLAKQRTRRLQCLQPFLDLCSTSQVTADVIPIEGDKEANAILELISALQIRTLVLGIPQRPRPRSSSSSSSSSSNIIITSTPKKEGRQGISGVAGRILEDAPEFCEVKIICQGKQLLDTAPSPTAAATATANSNNINNPSPLHPQQQQQQQQTHALGAYCKCFKPRTNS